MKLASGTVLGSAVAAGIAAAALTASGVPRPSIPPARRRPRRGACGSSRRSTRRCPVEHGHGRRLALGLARRRRHRPHRPGREQGRRADHARAGSRWPPASARSGRSTSSSTSCSDRPGDEPDHRPDPRRRPPHRDRDRPRLGLGREPARRDRVQSLAHDRPDDRNDRPGQRRDLARRDPQHGRRDLGRRPGRHGRQPDPAPDVDRRPAHPDPLRTHARGRTRLRLGRRRGQHLADPDHTRQRPPGSPCPAAAPTATAPNWPEATPLARRP